MDTYDGNKGKKKKWWITLLSILCFATLGFVSVFAFSGWQWPRGKHSVTQGPTAVFISIDGLRHDMLSARLTPNLFKLANEGIMVPLRPAYPSTTFPNHFTMITGLLPASHGIIGNTFYDHKLGVYRSKDNNSDDNNDNLAHYNGGWLQRGEPIWCAVEREGGRTAVVHYVGAGTRFNGIKPTYSIPFKRNTKQAEITDKLLSLIRKNGTNAPNLVVGYYSIVDKMSHKYGPDSREEEDALQQVDLEIGRLVSHIDGFKHTNLIIVSDHGAAKINTVIKLSELLPQNSRDKLIFSTCSPVTYLYCRPQDRHLLYKTINDTIMEHYEGKLKAYLIENVPKRWKFRDNDRLPSILIQANLGVTIRCDDTITTDSNEDNLGGDHGFDPFEYKQMWSLFIAQGPRFKQDTLSALQSRHTDDPAGTVDVYRVLANVLEVPLREGKTDSTPRLSNMVFNNAIL